MLFICVYMLWVVNIAISGLILRFCINIVTSKILEYSDLDGGDYGKHFL